VVVRLAGDGDAATLARLRWRWRADEEGETGLEQAVFIEAFIRWLTEHRESHIAWVAEVDGEAVGMAWLAVIDRVPRPGNFLRLAGNLQSVYVTPAERGKGVGLALVQAAAHEARRRAFDYVSVHPSRESFSLYRRAGFRGTDRVLELDLRNRAR
jgi:GNAT superfamily N-acetyltransferase